MEETITPQEYWKSIETVKEYESKYRKKVKKALDSFYEDKGEFKKRDKERFDKIKNNLSLTFIQNKLNMAENFYQLQPFFYDKNNLFWIWDANKNKYEIVDDVHLISLIDDYLGREHHLVQARNEIIESLKIIGRKKIPKDLPKDCIQFSNLIISLTTGERFKPSPNYLCTNPIDWSLSNEAETPIIDGLFRQWVKTEDEVKLLYEIIAYCLLPDYPLARIFCLYGKGSNGKSVYLNILSKFIGQDNCTSTSLESLTDNRFESAKMYKKLVCRLSEIHDKMLSKTSILKNISGGDSISVEFKNKNPFDAKIYSKIIIGTNLIPITTDDTDGFYRRWIIVDFPNQFADKRDILSEIPDSEFNNLCCKSINILKEIMQKREFTFDGDILNKRKRYSERSNPIESFIKERCLEDINSDSIFSDIYNQYTTYLSQKGFHSISKNDFGTALRVLGFSVKKKTINSFNSTYIEGLKLKEINNSEVVEMTRMTTMTDFSTFSPIRETNSKVILSGHLSHFNYSDQVKIFAKNEIAIETLLSYFPKEQRRQAEQTLNDLMKKGFIFETKSGFVRTSQ